MCLNEEMGSEVLFEDVRGTNERYLKGKLF